MLKAPGPSSSSVMIFENRALLDEKSLTIEPDLDSLISKFYLKPSST